MSESYELLPMRERIAIVKDLRKEYGDDVPTTELESVGFARQEQSEGVISFVAVERLAQLAIHESEAKDSIPLPATQFTIDVATDARIEAKLSRHVLGIKLNELHYKLNPSIFDERTLKTPWTESMLGGNSPFFPVKDAVDASIASQKECYPIRQVPYALNVQSIFGQGCFENALIPAYRQHNYEDDFFDMPITIDDEGNYVSNDFLTGPESEILMTRLQLMRSIVSDEVELYKQYDEELSEIYDVETGEGLFSDKDSLQADLLRGASMRLGMLAGVLNSEGYIQAAQQLAEVRNFSEARKVIAQAIQDNESKRAYKEFEKEWQEKRKHASGVDEIKVLSAERAQQKDALKASQRTLLGLDVYLNIPKHYSKYCLAAIKDMEDTLLVRTENDTVSLEFDTAPDPDLDQKAGEVSGDCTAGDRLQFSEESGLRNIKVRKLGQHIGNVYAMETSDVDDKRKIWHFDAIQIPDRSIDWAQFPGAFINAFAELAKEHNVDALTVNSLQHHISNYDYISKGFMQYFGTQEDWIEHGQMDLLDNPSKINADPLRMITVDIERYETHSRGFKQVQAASDGQVILWQLGDK